MITDLLPFSLTLRAEQANDEREQLLAGIQAEKEKLAGLVNSIQDEVWFSDTSGTFTLENESALREFAIGDETEIEIENFATSLEVFRPDGSLLSRRRGSTTAGFKRRSGDQTRGNRPHPGKWRIALSAGKCCTCQGW